MVKNKLFISKEWHIQPSEVDRLYFFEYEQILEEIHVVQKEEEKRQKEQDKQYGNMNPKSMMNSMRSTMGNMSMPKVSMPSMPRI